MDLVTLLVQLISGAIGGNVAAGILKKVSLGSVGNSIVGILGGGLGGVILHALGVGAAAGGTNAGTVIGSMAAGGIGGGALLAIVGAIRSAVGRSAWSRPGR